MAEQSSLRKVIHWLAASEIEIAEIFKCYQRSTITKPPAPKRAKKDQLQIDPVKGSGFLYTCLHLRLANGEMRMVTWLEDCDLNLKEVIVKAIDETWQENWNLYNWQSKDLESFDVEKLNAWWKGRKAA